MDNKNSEVKGKFQTDADFKQNKEVYSLTVANRCKYLHIESDIKVAINRKYKSDEMLCSMNQKTGRFIINEFLTELTTNSTKA